MDLTFTLADLTATSACEMRLYTELRERAQKQSVYPTPRSPSVPAKRTASACEC